MSPNISLQPGSTNTQAVKQLQDYLVSQGYLTQAQVNTGYGTYGPQTTAAVAKLQSDKGVDNSTGVGYFGPRTISAISNQPNQSSIQSSQPQSDPVKSQYSQEVASHPAFAGNSQQIIDNAIQTGDMNGILNSQGKPFSAQDQSSAVAEATSAVSPYYQAEQQKGTADTTAAMIAKQAAYQKYLDDQAAQFKTDKTTLDQNAANQGILFSGGRAQKEQQLGDTYNRNQTYNQSAYGNDIGNTARDFEYKYGTPAAAGLSQYYTLGSNTYNPKTATGGVTSGGLSNIYNTGNYQGTEINAAKTATQTRAANLLANKGNKLVPYGYKNQF